MRNNKQENAEKHLFIDNPFTGKQVNILPILQLCQTRHFNGFNNNDESVFQRLDDAIRLIATSYVEDSLLEEYKFVTTGLFELRDAFKNMVELK